MRDNQSSVRRAMAKSCILNEILFGFAARVVHYIMSDYGCNCCTKYLPIKLLSADFSFHVNWTFCDHKS